MFAPRGPPWLLSLGPLSRSDHDGVSHTRLPATGPETPESGRRDQTPRETEGQVVPQYRSPGGQDPSRAPETATRRNSGRGARRIPSPSSALRGRVVVAAVATGAFAAAGQSIATGQEMGADHHDDYRLASSGQEASALFSSEGMGGNAPAPEVLPVARTNDTHAELQKLAKGVKFAGDRAAKTAAELAAKAESMRPKVVQPAAGVFTSGFGGRWGTTHYGIDIANAKGTPIVSAMDGIVIEAGPASGFGLWVRVQHEDGTITVYGHVNTITTTEGAKVKAGQQIATMGNRGFSTGVHLHFEVWEPGGKKINPLPWLHARGVDVTGSSIDS